MLNGKKFIELPYEGESNIIAVDMDEQLIWKVEGGELPLVSDLSGLNLIAL